MDFCVEAKTSGVYFFDKSASADNNFKVSENIDSSISQNIEVTASEGAIYDIEFTVVGGNDAGTYSLTLPISATAVHTDATLAAAIATALSTAVAADAESIDDLITVSNVV